MTMEAITPKAKNQWKGYPRGWFVIAFSDELKRGELKPISYFDRDLVLFRTEEGQAAVLDAFCPHLGAHIGFNGQVVGDSVQCPFHHWRFDASGDCVDIPYCKGKYPPKAKLRSWVVKEQNQLIHLWYHPDHIAPQFDLPLLPCDPSQATADQWTPWKFQSLEIDTHSREIVENVVDIAHFIPVHGTHIDQFENAFQDHMAVQKSKGTAYPRGGGTDRFSLEATYYGPGFQITKMSGYLESLLVNAHTLIHENRVCLRFGVKIKPPPEMKDIDAIANMYVQNLTQGFLEDVDIWENKLFRDHPGLCAGDGPIMKLRKWYAQFYEAST